MRSTVVTLLLVVVLVGCGADIGPLEGAPGTAHEGDVAADGLGTVDLGDGEVLPAANGGTETAEPPADVPTYTREYWVSPKGNDEWEGSSSRPFRTISKAVRVLKRGEAARVLAGEYAENVIIRSAESGTKEAPIALLGEGKPRIIPTRTGGGVVGIERSYWRVEGFEIDARGTNQFGVYFANGAVGSSLSNSEVHHGTGGAGVSVFGGARDSRIENNHIHRFDRGSSDSHGVVVQPTSKRTYVAGNDIHDVSGDAVQCIGPEGFSNDPPADGLVVEKNHLYETQENAVDIKTCFNVVIRKNRMHTFRMGPASQGGNGVAVVVHLSAQNVLIEHNDISDAGRGIAIGGNRFGPVPGKVVVHRNRIHDLVTVGGMDGGGIRIENSEGARVLHNTLVRVPGIGLVVGFGTGGPTSNLYVANNIIEASHALDIGSQAPGLRLESNLYSGTASVRTWKGHFTMQSWKEAGLENRSLVADGGLTHASSDDAPGADAVDKGVGTGASFCGEAPDIGAVETGC